MSPPNIILLLGDDHGWEETGYNGHAHVQTPVLDAMAASGLRLDRFNAAHPTCSPTRASILTGRHPNRYKLVVRDGPEGSEPALELFDLQGDPAEAVNRADQEPVRVNTMQAALDAWQATVLTSLVGGDY